MDGVSGGGIDIGHGENIYEVDLLCVLGDIDRRWLDTSHDVSEILQAVVPVDEGLDDLGAVLLHLKPVTNYRSELDR